MIDNATGSYNAAFSTAAAAAGESGAQTANKSREDQAKAGDQADSTSLQEQVSAIRKEAVEALSEAQTSRQYTVADFWRTRFDPESLRAFTEVVDPVTRETLYRVPPTMELSDEAQREGESQSRRERALRDNGLVV